MATTSTSATPATASTSKTSIVFSPHTSHELARYSANFFTGIVVAIAFLLLGGLHQPPTWLLVFMYTGLGATALTALLSLPITILEGSPAAGKLQNPQAARLRMVQILQMIVFVIAVAAVVGFAIEMSLLFFPAATAAPTAAQG